jgi:hypothetical protein
MTQAELGKALGVQQPCISKLIKRGMPSDSIEAAREWRDANINNSIATEYPSMATILMILSPRRQKGKQ